MGSGSIFLDTAPDRILLISNSTPNNIIISKKYFDFFGYATPIIRPI
jgi:hypothetical protein